MNHNIVNDISNISNYTNHYMKKYMIYWGFNPRRDTITRFLVCNRNKFIECDTTDIWSINTEYKYILQILWNKNNDDHGRSLTKKILNELYISKQIELFDTVFEEHPAQIFFIYTC